MRLSVQQAPLPPTQILRLGGCPANILIQNIGGSQFAVVGTTNASPDITWVSGGVFNVAWPPGTPISIGGASYTISSVTSTTALVLTANFAGATGNHPLVLLSSIYVSDIEQALSGPLVSGTPQTGIVVGAGGALTLQNWTSDLFAVSDTAAVTIEVVVNTTGIASVQAGRSAQHSASGAPSSGGGSFGGSGIVSGGKDGGFTLAL